jgi:hypothetical protein
MHIQSRADSDDVNGMMAMVMIVIMIVLVMVNIVPEALNLIQFHWPNALQRKLNLRCLHLSASPLK